MGIHYSVLITVEEDDSLVDLPSNLSEAIIQSAKGVPGVTDASVIQLVPGDVLYPPSEP